MRLMLTVMSFGIKSASFDAPERSPLVVGGPVNIKSARLVEGNGGMGVNALLCLFKDTFSLFRLGSLAHAV